MSKPLTTKVMPGAPKAGGYLHYSPLGTALPTDATTALAAGWINLGYISNDGVKPEESTKVEDERDWAEDVVLTADGEVTLKRSATLISTLEYAVNVFLFGAGNVTKVAATPTTPETIAVARDGAGIESCQICLDLVFGTRIRREVFPIMKPTLTGRLEYKKVKAQGYSIELTAHRDANGKFMYDYMTDGVKGA